MEKNALVRLFGEKKVWLNWTLEKKVDKDGNQKMTKIPRRLDGSHGSATDPTSWVTYEQALAARDKFSGVGIVFEDLQGIVGLDLDKCIVDGRVYFDDPKKIDAVNLFLWKANTYVEVSPSGTGLHIFLTTKDVFTPLANKTPASLQASLPILEVYTRGRYFTFTGNIYGEEREVREVSLEELKELLSILGYPWGKDKGNAIKPPPVTVGYSSPFSDENVLLEKVFASKGGDKTKAVYNGDLSYHNNDASSADLYLCNRLAFWTGRDKERMRRIWLGSPLGQREKTQKRVAYQDMTLDRAIEGCHNIYTPRSGITTESGVKEDGSIEFIMSAGTEKKDPAPLLIFENICRVIALDPYFNERFRLNDFSHMIEAKSDGKWKNLLDEHIYEAVRRISSEYSCFRSVKKEMVTDAIRSVASGFKVNPPKDYLVGLQWDEKPRLDSWMFYAFGVPDDVLHQKIGSNWMKGIVKRVMRPGCQFDEVLVLEGPQGWRKSSAMRVLGQPWHAESTLSVDDKDFYMLLAQNMIVEFSEGEVFERSSARKLKSIITKVEDQYRPPYERGIGTFPRGCVFAMTVNDANYLKDDTGGRRWLPVKLGKIADVEWVKENRDQLFAEAYHRVITLGETTHEYPKEDLEDLQESRREHTDQEDAVVEWYISNWGTTQNGITMKSVFDGVLNPSNSPRTMNRLDESVIKGMLMRSLYLEYKNKRVSSTQVKHLWLPTSKTLRKHNLVLGEGNVDTF